MLVTNLKALAVVLALASLVFAFAKPLTAPFIDEVDFIRRRNTWLLLTSVAFISPSFWIYVAVAVPVLTWLGMHDRNVAALYLLMLHVIPPFSVDIPVVGINRLFELNNYRILSLTVLIPAAWRLLHRADPTTDKASRTMDWLLVSFAALHLLLLVPYESVTHTLRRGFLYTIDALLVYFVFSRLCIDRRTIAEAMASFVLACALFAPIALFESIRGWLLYTGIGEQWGAPIPFAYLLRAGILRAQAAAGHSLPLGYMLALAFGFWLYLSSKRFPMTVAFGVGALLWAGMIASYARAPWIVGIFVLLAFGWVAPDRSRRIAISLLGLALATGAVLVLPIGGRLIDSMPFIGSVDVQTISYRQTLALRAWELIQEHPFLGNPFVLLQMEDLRQGQGIIDLVNSYAAIGMFYGIPALFLLVGFFVAGLCKVYLRSRSLAKSDGDVALLGGAIFATMLGTLLMMATGSFGTGLEKMFYVLAGLAAGYAQLTRHPARENALA